MKDVSPQKRKLDVVILHDLILEKLLGLKHGFENKKNIIYNNDEDHVFQLVDKGKCRIAFLLRPTDIEHVRKVAFSSQKMPQKSTYFYPKVLTGLAISDFHI